MAKILVDGGRIAAITGSENFKGNEALAQVFIDNGMEADVALKALAAAAPAIAPTETVPAAGAAQAAVLEQIAADNPAVAPDAAPEGNAGEAGMSAEDQAAAERREQRKRFARATNRNAK